MPIHFLRKNPMAVVLAVGGLVVLAVLLTMIDGGLLKSQVSSPESSGLTYSCEVFEIKSDGIEADVFNNSIQHRSEFLDENYYDVRSTGNCYARVSCSVVLTPDKLCEDYDMLRDGSNSCEDESFQILYVNPTPVFARAFVANRYDRPHDQLTQQELSAIEQALEAQCGRENTVPSETEADEICEGAWNNPNPSLAPDRSGFDDQQNLTLECRPSSSGGSGTYPPGYAEVDLTPSDEVLIVEDTEEQSPIETAFEEEQYAEVDATPSDDSFFDFFL